MIPNSNTAPAPAQWVLHSRVPAAWQRHVERLDGGFFHSPAGLDSIGAAGEPMFLEWRSGGQTVGIAAGLRCRSPLTGLLTHAYLPTPPAVLAGDWNRGAALASLLRAMRAERVVELTCDAFHADGAPPLETGPAELHRRHEYVVALDGAPNGVLARWSASQRRALQAASKQGWTVTMPRKDEARDVVADVNREAGAPPIGRAEEPFIGGPTLDLALGITALGRAWGRTLFAVWENGRPIAVAVVGWANRRAYYLLGLATRAGRARPATTWLHWRIMCALLERGFVSYGLGGAPASAAEPGDPVYGLHQFRVGLGAVPVPCAGARWVLDPLRARTERPPEAMPAFAAG